MAVLVKKIALMLACDKRVQTTILSALVGIIAFIILFFGVFFSICTAESQMQKDIIKYIFYPDLPINDFEEGSYFYDHIVSCRKELPEIKEESEGINKQNASENEDEKKENSIDILKAQVIYYVLFLEGNGLELPPKEDFISCFYEKKDDEITIIKKEKTIYTNIEMFIEREITEEEKERIAEILRLLTDDTTILVVNGEFGTPVEPEYMSSITSPFGTRVDPITGKASAFHNGTDIAWGGCHGSNIYAVSNGVVTRASDVGDGFGKCVIIDHGGGMLTYYAHCSSVSVSVGEQVVKGQHVSNIGSTGRSTGSHLHFGLKINGNWQQPMSLFQKK